MLLREFILPRFRHPKMAREFRRLNDESKFAMRRFFLFFGVFAYSAHLFLDWMVGQDYVEMLMCYRGVGSLLMLLLAVSFAFPKSRSISDSCTMTMYLACGAGAIIAQSDLHTGVLLAGIWPMGLIIVLGFGASILAPSFLWTAGLVCVVYTAHWAHAAYIDNTPLLATITHAWLLTIGFVSIVIGSLTRERLEREAYLDELELIELNSDLDTARVEAEESRDQAEAARKIQSEFIGTMTHELKTPLNAVIGFSEFILTEPHGSVGHPEYVNYIKMIQDAGQAQLANVEDLLDLRRLETGKMSWEDSAFTVREAVETAVARTSRDAEAASVTVTIEDSVSHRSMWSDRRRFIQVVNNLLTNAFRWTDEDGSVTVSAIAQADGTLRVSVADTGCGISESDLERIQGMFQQAGDGSASVAKGGLGVGLAIVKGILDWMDSCLVIESELGEGTICHVDINPSRLADDEMKLVGT